jgi:N-acetylglutamate synthase-like GNAT family acetyltransferase
MDAITIRDALESDAGLIHAILSEAFRPYREHYTEEAYNVTVCSVQEIIRRIDDDRFDVLVAEYNNQVVGTAAMYMSKKGKVYLSSMAVRPTVQGKGAGYYLLKTVEHRARERDCEVVVLECCEFLRMAIGLYKRMGYKRTGRKRPYHGVEVFEMQRQL